MPRVLFALFVGLLTAQATQSLDAPDYLALNDVVDLGLEYLNLKDKVPLPGFEISSERWFTAILKLGGSVKSLRSLKRTDDSKLYRGDNGALVFEVSLGFEEIMVGYTYYARIGIIETDGWVNATMGSNSIRARGSYTRVGGNDCKLSVDSVDLVDFGKITIDSTLRSCPFLEKRLPWDWMADALHDVTEAIIQKKLREIQDNPLLQRTCL
ncbi:uncharacterized protein LOC117646794 [Thrips palmi]|uniref:Uncharacterized protein LOC117646794 n=1 Tax=Thrips palmi TaxID=161013 RepID=A0A6P8ZPD3_THRPL|nr:uncharacterized protein LOC117646794 [Thrips palmi]